MSVMEFCILLFVLMIFYIIVATIYEVLVPPKTKYQRVVESKAKLEARLAKIKKEEEQRAEEKRQQDGSLLCPRQSNFTRTEYGSRFHRVWCYQGIAFTHISKWTREGACAMASECPGAYHKISLEE